ncbi:MAG: hypothetical protein J6C37_10695 [Roseburia sp.]|nr:hypothetical protein [Roseburia sp.]
MSATSLGQIVLDLVLNQNGFNKQMLGVNKLAKKAGAALAAAFSIKKLVEFSKECLELGSDLQEVQNVVDVTFPAMKAQVDDFAKSAAASFGLSETMAKQFTGTFGSMAKAFGFTEQQAYDMGTTLTGLAGDVASFYNLTQEEAYTKLKSVFTGETESLKDLGVVMSQTALDNYALAKGFGKTTSAMSEAEKVALRYQFVQEQLSAASGDFQRTSDGWANQVRVLNLQIDSLKATIGQGLINLFTPVIQVINTLLGKLSTLAEAFKSFTELITGNEAADTQISSAITDAENLSDTVSGVEDAAKAAAKEMRSLAGFDDIQKLGDNTSASSDSDASIVGSSIDFGSLAQGETILEKTESQIQGISDSAKELLRNIAKYVGLAVAALGGLKLGGFISDLATANIKAKTLKGTLSLLGKKMAITAGITLVVTGIALEGAGIYDAFTEGLDLSNFGEILLGGTGLTGGLSLAMSQLFPTITLFGAEIGGGLLGGALGGIIAGIPMFVTGIYDSLVRGIDWLSAALTSIGSTAAGAGIGAIIGALGGPITAGIGALIGLAVGLVTDLVILVVQKWDVIVEWCSSACTSIGEFFSGLWSSVRDIWSVVSGWFDTNVVQPVCEFFSGLWSDISLAASSCWDSIVAFFSPAYTWFSQLFTNIRKTISDIFYNIGVIANGCWAIIEACWQIVSAWFRDKVVAPVGNFFSTLWIGIKSKAINAWNGIKEVFSTIGNWINTKIVQPVGNFFSNLWTGFTDKAKVAWAGVKTVFGNAASFFEDTFQKAWQGIVNVFSVAGEIFVKIKDGILSGFKSVANEIIGGLNSAIAVPFNGINSALQRIKEIEILGIKPFSGISTISVPQIPLLANGGYVKANTPQLAMIGDNRHQGEVVAPEDKMQQMADDAALKTIATLENYITAMMAGFEAVVQAINDKENSVVIGDEEIGKAAGRYQSKMAIIKGGT